MQRRIQSWWLLIPLAVLTWALLHESGIHATVAGVLLGFAVPAFAFFAAGVTVGCYTGFLHALSDPVAVGIIAALVVGKAVGVFGTTRLLSAVTRASLDSAIRWVDVFGIALLAGIGFTVSLLIGELAYGVGSDRDEHVKIGVLTGSVIAAVLASTVLMMRNRHYRKVCAEESATRTVTGCPTCSRPRKAHDGGAESRAGCGLCFRSGSARPRPRAVPGRANGRTVSRSCVWARRIGLPRVLAHRAVPPRRTAVG